MTSAIIPVNTSAAQAYSRGCILQNIQWAGIYPSNIYRSSSSQDIDSAINRELGQLSLAFSVKPGFYLLKVEHSFNFFATPQVIDPSRGFSDGSILFDFELISTFNGSSALKNVIPIIMAHEFAHILQLKRMSALPIKLNELQADYLAGWYLYQRSRSTKTDIEMSAYAFTKFIEDEDEGFNDPEFHGDTKQRIQALMAGTRLPVSSTYEAYERSLRYVTGLDRPAPREAPPQRPQAVEPRPAEPTQTRPEPKIIAQELKKVARRELESPNTQIISNIQFNVSTKDKKISYNIGKVRMDHMGFSRSDPYGVPFEKQIHIEALKDVFMKSVPNETFWVQPLRNAETLVYQTIQDIESSQDVGNLSSVLRQRKIEIDRELENLTKNITEFARENRFKVLKVADTDAPEKMEVSIIIEPSGGKVRLITNSEYDLHKNILKESKDKWPWRDLLESTARLLGKYHYLVEWTDGKCDEGDMTVDSKFSRTFRPGKCD